MASSFQCRVVSHRQTGAVEIEQQSCSEISTGQSTNQPRTIEVVRAVFPPEKLNVIDINAKRRYLIGQGFTKDGVLARLRGIFGNAGGGKAREALAMPEFADSAVITGGIYFAKTDHVWPETGEKTKQGDGFVYFRPHSTQPGHILSEERGHFMSGGYLFLTPQGEAQLVRKQDIKITKESAPESGVEAGFTISCKEGILSTRCDLQKYRLVLQSNIILVADGVEDHNRDDSRQAVSALSVQQDGKLALVAAYEPEKPTLGFGLTHREFGELLIRLGSWHAVNLDGGPSVQFAARKPNCNHPTEPEKCVEDLIRRPRSELPNPMPQLFSVDF